MFPRSQHVRKCRNMKGVEFEHYDDIPGITREGDLHVGPEGMACSWFKDSEDNIISVMQMA